MNKIKDILFGIVMIGLFLGPLIYFKVWWLFWTFLTFGIIFGLYEWLAKAKTGSTVSEHFWEFSKKNRVGAFIILGSMLLFWIILLIHLSAKMW